MNDDFLESYEQDIEEQNELHEKQLLKAHKHFNKLFE